MGDRRAAFNPQEAYNELAYRWARVHTEMNDNTLPDEDRPKVYATPAPKGWGQNKLVLQPATDFLQLLNASLAKNKQGTSGRA
eukprot:CAMPEP_0202891146 /NCGR_PEP_ID=MMETSP1392-20130828/1294_1 /ASSEMBLY_ACC=CAM_ASM_000868 /TAXON_ID=225041 /ORGANISM="Chlamydomonas chlamydogama, Strain SAG 11-48b" /LENGTH=82 /DNA_ID=CAMNT_0049574825 /DNA_START=106 /DNA_END=354 /DNA_ORIENTATION=+